MVKLKREHVHEQVSGQHRATSIMERMLAVKIAQASLSPRHYELTPPACAGWDKNKGR